MLTYAGASEFHEVYTNVNCLITAKTCFDAEACEGSGALNRALIESLNSAFIESLAWIEPE